MTKILVIEDEEPLRERIAECLTYEGYEVIAASDGREGVDLAMEHLPNLIVSDIAMPGMDGYQVLWEMRRKLDTATIPFIFLTAKVDRTFVRYGMELGADDYLTKPFTTDELVGTIKTRLLKQDMVSRAAARELEPIKKRLAHTVSHELRSPLASISMAQMLLSRQWTQLEPDQINDLLDTLQLGSHRLNHLVEQMVLMTQFDTEVLSREVVELYSMPIPIWSLLAGAINLARQYTYRNRNVEVKVRERDRDAVIRCHSQSLIHALAEVIANALDFSPSNVEVVVSQWKTEDSVCITVSDSGPGIPADAIARALQDFEQIDRDTQEQQGVGLGLPLAQKIIEIHGGKLELTSQPGSGTEVLIQMPLFVG
jgi:two-component system sensor histidine kinase/response regulator